jgi:hypothetical protein
LHTRLKAVFALMSGLLFRFLGAFFAVEPQKTGLSAPIPQPPCGGLRDFRFNPFRGITSASGQRLRLAGGDEEAPSSRTPHVHCSLFIANCSLLIVHFSLLIAHC